MDSVEIIIGFIISNYLTKQKSKCECKRPKFTRTVDDEFKPLCGSCGKQI